MCAVTPSKKCMQGSNAHLCGLAGSAFVVYNNTTKSDVCERTYVKCAHAGHGCSWVHLVCVEGESPRSA